MNYVQCRLSHINGKREMSWIPERYAVRDKVLSIKNDGFWEDGWRVVETYGKRDESAVLAMSERHKHHRNGSDI